MIKTNYLDKDADEIAYHWPLYKSLLFHLLVWSVNLSECERQVWVEIDLLENTSDN